MAIIEAEMPKETGVHGELAVVKRCIHTAADFDYASNLYFSPDAVELAVDMMKSGKGFTIVTDTNMALAGVNKAALKAAKRKRSAALWQIRMWRLRRRSGA